MANGPGFGSNDQRAFSRKLPRTLGGFMLLCFAVTSSAPLTACGKVDKNRKHVEGRAGDVGAQLGGAGQGSGGNSHEGSSEGGRAGQDAGEGGGGGQGGSDGGRAGQGGSDGAQGGSDGAQAGQSHGGEGGDLSQPQAPEDCQQLGDEDGDGVACSDPVWGNIYHGDPIQPGSNQSFGTAVATDASNNVFWGITFDNALKIGNETFTSAGNLDALLVKLDPQGNVLWAQQYGDSSGQGILSLAVDSMGNVVFVGGFSGTMSIGDKTLTAGPVRSAFAAKLDPAGNVLFAQSYSGGYGWISSVALDQATEDPIVSGQAYGSIDLGGGAVTIKGPSAQPFVGRLDHATGLANSARTWTKAFGDSGSSFSALHGDPFTAVDSAGGVVLAGNFSGSITFPGGQPAKIETTKPQDAIYVIKLDPAGKPTFARAFEGSLYPGSYVAGVTTTRHGSVILLGIFTGSIDFGGGTLTTAGTPGAYATDFFLTELDTNLAHVKSIRVGDAAENDDDFTEDIGANSIASIRPTISCSALRSAAPSTGAATTLPR